MTSLTNEFFKNSACCYHGTVKNTLMKKLAQVGRLIFCTGIIGSLCIQRALAQTTLLPSDMENGGLGYKIASGEIHLSDLPAFIAYFINFGIVIAAAVCLLFLVIGGYRYIVGGVVEAQREQGKQTIMYAIIGLVVSALAWTIVNTVQLLVT